MKKAGLIHVRLRLDFESGQSVGPGKIALLEKIGVCGSLSQAARELGISYRRAWLLLDDLNNLFKEPVATTLIGGKRGGGATVTDLGHRLIADFHRVERAANAASRHRFTGLTTTGTKSSAAAPALRQRLSRPLRRAKGKKG